MTLLADEKLENLLELCAVATQSWYVHERGIDGWKEWEIVQSNGGVLFRSTSYPGAKPDATLIAACDATTIAALVKEVIELRAEVAGLQTAFEARHESKR